REGESQERSKQKRANGWDNHFFLLESWGREIAGNAATVGWESKEMLQISWGCNPGKPGSHLPFQRDLHQRFIAAIFTSYQFLQDCWPRWAIPDWGLCALT